MSGIRRRFSVGVDLGQSRDYTAISVLERVELKGEWDPVLFAHRKNVALRLRYLERIALGTSYPEVVRRVAEVLQSQELDGLCQLIVDATGVGRPVVDLLRGARLNCSLLPVIVTGGVKESYVDGYYHCPKLTFITGLQVALQQGALQMAAGLPHGETLMEEMAQMRVRITPAGNEQFGAWREGSHDDLVFAVALACWGVRKAFPFDFSGRERY